MIRIAHVITDLQQNGAEIALLRLSSQIDRDSFESRVFTLKDRGPLAGAFEDASIPVESMSMSGAASLPAGLWRLRRQLNSYKPDIVQTWLYHADLAGTVARAMLAPPRPLLAWNIRCSRMDSRYERGTGALLLRALALLSSRPRAIVVNSLAGLTFHRSIGYSPREWIHMANGFDCDEFRPRDGARDALLAHLEIPKDSFVVGFVARNDPIKDHATFFAAAAEVAAQRANTHFVLVGAGIEPGDQQIRQSISRHQISDHIHLLGKRNDVAQLDAAFDVAVCASRGEGFPNVLCEAMAAGTPCVSTDVGDARTIIGDTGFVVDVGDSSKMAEGLIALADYSSTEILKLGQRARQRIMSRYSLDAAVALYERFYTSLAAGDNLTDLSALTPSAASE